MTAMPQPTSAPISIRPISERVVVFKGAEISTFTVPTHERHPRGRSAGRAVLLMVPLEAAIHVTPHAGSPVAVRAGEAIIMNDHPHNQMGAFHATPALRVIVPAETVNRTFSSQQTETPLVVSGSPLLASATAFLLELLTADDGVPGDELSTRITERLVCQLVSSLYLATCLAAEPARSTASIVTRASALIDAGHTDPALSPESVAHSLNVSIRQLQRAFSSTGRTPSQYIREIRVGHAVALLQSPSHARASVPQLAARTGFRTAAELRRALAATGNSTPRHYRPSSQ